MLNVYIYLNIIVIKNDLNSVHSRIYLVYKYRFSSILIRKYDFTLSRHISDDMVHRKSLL